ncbi:unnamed protein product [Cuscuta campestris]|uniref:F-box domain-containing protein n=1 Tax=Cuscuta campestris TaxID=132261 RepID=A0A484NJN7_9ASTE|nr:unnamed protein product [Cuscuta campestris]
MSVKEYQPFLEMPSSLLWEILGRVPIKTCLACKLVCKEWYRNVISPEFSSFRRHCIPSRFTIVFHEDRGCGPTFNFVEIEKTLDVDASGNCTLGIHDQMMVDPKIGSNGKYWYVRSHCNGVCFLSTKNDNFICNLLTGQHVYLQNQYFCGSELGYCPVLGQFKLLILLWDKRKKFQFAKIQTLGNGEWKSLGNAPLNIMQAGCFLNGSSHWCGDNCIWFFHFGEEKFSQIPIPSPDFDVPKTFKKKTKTLSIFDSCLCLSCFTGSGCVKIDIWIMKEYGVKESWVRQLVIVHDAWSVPLMPMDNGKILIESGNQLYLYDLESHVSKRVNFNHNGYQRVVLPVGFDARFSRFDKFI